MDKIEYTKRLEDLLGEYHIVKYENIDGYTRIASSETDWHELKKAIQQLNNEAIGQTDIQVRGITQNKENPMYWTKSTRVDFELRQELRNILGASNE